MKIMREFGGDLGGKGGFQEDFWRRAGRNLRAAFAMIDTLPGAAFYVKDAKGRFVAANRRNLDVCGLAREEDVIGRTSADLFPEPLARAYMELDRRVRETAEPVVKTMESPTGDFSTDRLVKSVFPVFGRGGRVIGTMCVYVQTPAPAAMPEWHGKLREVTSWIAANPGEPMTLSSIARRARLPPKRLEALFSEFLGTSVAKFVAVQRLSAARRMLETTDETVSSIAQTCGFYDHSHFSKAFCRKWGVSPGAYREKIRSPAGSGADSSGGGASSPAAQRRR